MIGRRLIRALIDRTSSLIEQPPAELQDDAGNELGPIVRVVVTKIDPAARVRPTWRYNDGQLEAIEIQCSATLLGIPGFAARMERVLSTHLRATWTGRWTADLTYRLEPAQTTPDAGQIHPTDEQSPRQVPAGLGGR